MSSWKVPGLLAVLLVILWLLYPSRQLAGQSEPGQDVVEISYMGPGGLDAGAMADAIREFEKWSEARHAQDPSQPVYRVVSGQNAARDMVADPTRYLVASAGGAPPDVVWFDRFAVAEWASRGAFQPLDEFIAEDLAARQAGKLDIPTPTRERFYPAAWYEGSYEGKVYGIPNCIDDRALFYNENALVRLGFVQDPNAPAKKARPPRTWEELREYAYELTEWEPEKPKRPAAWDYRKDFAVHLALRQAGWDPAKLKADLNAEERAYAAKAAEWSKVRKLKGVGFIPNFGNSWLYIYGWMNGADPDNTDTSKPRMFMSWDGKTCTLNDPRVVEALEYMKELYDDLGGYAEVNAFRSGFQGGELDPFINGKVIMKIDGQWMMNHQAQYGPDMDFGVAAPPRPAKCAAKPMSWTGGWAYAIPSTAKHAKAGWEFIRFMISDRALLIINNVNRDIAEAQGRLFIPGQCPVKEINELLFQRFVYEHPTMPERLKEGCRVFNDLLPYAMYRPVTPVGQRLWNEHVTAMEQACLGQATPQAALDDCTQKVQFWVEKHYDTSKKGVPIASWTWFFVLYPLLLVALAVGVFYWDTHLEFRRRLARLLHLPGARADAVVEGSKGGYFRSQWWGGLVCVSPWLVGFIIFGGGPLLFSLVISFCDYDILRPPEYVGLQNFRVLFTQDDNFGTSLGNTVYMVLGVPLGMLTGLAVALLLNLKIRGMAVWRTFFYLPAIVPMVASSILWIWILNANGGFINKVLGFFGVPGPLWLDSPAWSKPAIIVMGLWGAGASMVIWLAGLKAIDPSLYEAADVDGANEWQKLWHITLPQLTPYIFFNLVMGLIGTFQIFGQAFIMTQGGPGNSTLFYVYYLFNNAFRYGHMGYAAAMAWVLFVIVLGLTIVQLKLSKRWVHYEAG